MRRRSIGVLALAVSLASCVCGPPAVAAPQGAFAVFADCPLGNPEVSACLRVKTESGELVVGKRMLPITSPFILQGGLIAQGPGQAFVGAADGVTLSKSPQLVPGGLRGVLSPSVLPRSLQGRFNELINTNVTTTTELAAPASSIGFNEGNIINEVGVGLLLPVKIHLENVFLGGSCYIGSNANPIILAMTDGSTSPPLPNRPISGRSGKVEFIEGGSIIRVTKAAVVDNSFALPKASSCGGSSSSVVDSAVDVGLGIPSPAGHNTAIFNNSVYQTAAEEVRRHE
jgi:hypothetical protein